MERPTGYTIGPFDFRCSSSSIPIPPDRPVTVVGKGENTWSDALIGMGGSNSTRVGR